VAAVESDATCDGGMFQGRDEPWVPLASQQRSGNQIWISRREHE
jgi:hypothetical protein